MRTVVIGAGAIGSFVALRLGSTRSDITLVARGSRFSHLARYPVRLASEGRIEEWTVPVVAPLDLAAPVDLAILCTKTPAFQSALDTLAGKLAPGAVVLTLQNGVEAHEEAAKRFPDASIVAARMHGFFEMDGNVACHFGVTPSIVYGCTHGQSRHAHAIVADAFAPTSIRTQLSPDIVHALWEKFMLAACLGGIAAALGIPAGGACRDVGSSALLRTAMQEVAGLARAAGVLLTDPQIEATLAFVGSFPPEVTTSLQRDLEARKTSEYDSLTGAVTRLARLHGFTPVVFPHIETLIRARGLI